MSERSASMNLESQIAEVRGELKCIVEKFNDLRHDIDLRFSRTDTNDAQIRAEMSHGLEEAEKIQNTYRGATATRLIDMQNHINNSVPRAEWGSKHENLENRMSQLEKNIWMASGGVTILMVVLQVFMHLWK